MAPWSRPRTACSAAAYDVVACAEEVLAREPGITLREDDVPRLALAWIAFFVAAELLLVPLVRRVAKTADGESRVRIRRALVSCVHDIITIPMVVALLASLSHASEGPGGLLGIGPLAHIPMHLIDKSGAVFVGFLLYDSGHYLVHCKRSRLARAMSPHASTDSGVAVDGCPVRAQLACTRRRWSRTWCTTPSSSRCCT